MKKNQKNTNEQFLWEKLVTHWWETNRQLTYNPKDLLLKKILIKFQPNVFNWNHNHALGYSKETEVYISNKLVLTTNFLVYIQKTSRIPLNIYAAYDQIWDNQNSTWNIIIKYKISMNTKILLDSRGLTGKWKSSNHLKHWVQIK